MKKKMKNKIIIAGAAVLDVLVCPVDEQIFQKGSVPVETIRISTGGDALNEATILSRLKEDGEPPVYLLTVLGKDQAGQTILAHCQKESISTELTAHDAAMETGVNVVMVQKDGSRSFFTNPESSLRKLSLTHIPERFPEDAGFLCLASIFVSPLLRNGELGEIFRRAKRQGMCVCADMTKCKNQETTEDIREALSYLDYLFANEEEARMVTGKESLEDMADAFWECGVKNAVIKCGGRGCYVKNRELSRQFPAFPGTLCRDTTGAGDSFAAGFLYALSQGKALEECICWANTCGSLATEAVGACEGINNRAQVLERLEEYRKLVPQKTMEIK